LNQAIIQATFIKQDFHQLLVSLESI